MSIYNSLKEKLKLFLKEKDEAGKLYARNLKAKVDIYLVNNNLNRIEVADEHFIKATKAYKKMLLKGISEIEKGLKTNTTLEAIKAYKAEAEFCDSFLPEIDEPSEDEIRKVVKEVISSLNVSDKSQMGRVMGSIMKSHKNFDGNVVKCLVLKELNVLQK